MPSSSANEKKSVEDYLPAKASIDEKWFIMHKIGEGGFGQVYKCYDLRRKKCAAMKISPKSDGAKNIAMEVKIMQMLVGKTKHSARFIEHGEWRRYIYIVIELLGINLSRIRKACPMGRFTISTVCRVAVQCIEAIKDLHSIKYIHRDIKTANFMTGIGSVDEIRNVYLIDFGLAKCYINADGNHYEDVGETHFRGTLKYAPIATHESRHLGRSDDLWSLFYTIVEMLVGTLPWASLKTKTDVYKCKLQHRKVSMYSNIQKQVLDMQKYLNMVSFKDQPDYQFLIDLFESLLKSEKGSWDDEYDWEKKPEDKKHKKLRQQQKRSPAMTP